MIDLEKIEAYCEKASEGPWDTDCEGDHGRVVFIWGGKHCGLCVFRPSIDVVRGELCCEINGDNLENDLAFIENAPVDLPACVREIRELRAENERLKKLLENIPNPEVLDKFRRAAGEVIDASEAERNEAIDAMHDIWSKLHTPVKLATRGKG